MFPVAGETEETVGREANSKYYLGSREDLLMYLLLLAKPGTTCYVTLYRPAS